MRYLKLFLFSFAIYFFSWFLLYKLGINSLPIQSEDVVPSVFTGITIVEEKTLYLNSYYEMMVGRYPQPDDPSLTPFYLRKVGDNYLSAFPIMSSVISFPVFYIYSLFVNIYSWSDIFYLSHLSGSFILSSCVILLYYYFEKILRVSNKMNLVLISIYAFATINLSLISQGLWQHGAVQFFIILGLIFWSKERFFWSYLFLGFAILSRPTAAIVLIVLGLFMLYQRKITYKLILNSALGLLIPVLFFLFYNFTYYQSFSNQGYSSQLENSWLGNFPESFFGMWLSPSKGILIYTPVFLFSLIGIYQGFKNNSLIRISFWVILLHTLVLSKWKHWYGGYGFGYRMVSDILPFFIFPIWYLLENFYERVKKAIVLTLSLSIIIQISGLVFFDSIWHNAYDTGFRNTSWLWSIKDSEAAFNIRRVLVKVNLLDKACDKCEGN